MGFIRMEEVKGESISQRVHMIQNLFSKDEFRCNTETSRQGYKASACKYD